LKAHGVEAVVICGVSTSVGVESTARQGTGLGFAFVVVEDACGAMVVEEHAYAVKITFPRLAKVHRYNELVEIVTPVLFHAIRVSVWERWLLLQVLLFIWIFLTS
jgi:nicotinamidase-related amidase